MAEVYLVLAPNVNFFLDSRKQGLPCWRSLLILTTGLVVWLVAFVSGLNQPKMN